MDRRNSPHSAKLVLNCDDLEAALAFYVGELGFRLDMIMPADAPRLASVSGFGISLRLKQRSEFVDGASAARGNVLIEPVEEVTLDLAMPVIDMPIIKRADGRNEWSTGRAGMQYRDLIPDRVDGRVIASQIRIEQGGLVDDYVHYHKVGLQLIYCRRGWVRVVYEDQGPPFVMQPGDCVLQPPMIRHRVLESSAGLEVIELGIPAVHETWRDHDLTLPTTTINSKRDFGGQMFVRHIAADARLQDDDAIEIRDIGIDAATNQTASARVIHLRGKIATPAKLAMPRAAFRFLFVLDGSIQLLSSSRDPVTLATDDAGVLASTDRCLLQAITDTRVLDIRIRAA